MPLFHLDSAGFKERLQALCPHLGLLVSGGNTLLFSMDEGFAITILAQTQDDAAGEALDKGAKLLGLPYPGGPRVEQLASQGNRQKYAFPRAYAHQDVMKFSFSGLKTSLFYFLKKMEPNLTAAAMEASLPDICASYQEAVFDQLVNKVKEALNTGKGNFRSIGLSGGVSQNARLRHLMSKVGEKYSLPVQFAQKEHSGDNAAMIAFAACVDRGHVVIDDAFDLTFEPSLELS
jgi:N6-L-threonylcarbamoyladenine synthase